MRSPLFPLIAGVVISTAVVASAGVPEDVECLALNAYFEARGEPRDGQLAVSHVVMNRVASDLFPDTVCGVIWQAFKPGGACQFSWTCDGRGDTPTDVDAWQESRALALAVYWGYEADPTGGALWYHADYVLPEWAKGLRRGPMIGRHLFYYEAE